MPTWDQPADEADVFTIEEVAAYFKVHHTTVREWIKNGDIVAITLPRGGLRIHRNEILRMLSHTTTKQTQEQ